MGKFPDSGSSHLKCRGAGAPWGHPTFRIGGTGFECLQLLPLNWIVFLGMSHTKSHLGSLLVHLPHFRARALSWPQTPRVRPPFREEEWQGLQSPDYRCHGK